MHPVSPLPTAKGASALHLADILFILAAALYAWLAYQGTVLLSASGTLLDSDLQVYAQGLARAFFPENFAADPMLAHKSAANSLQNVQSFLAELLLENENFGLALLKAGSIALFCFYCFWYAFGRSLFGAPCLAALLALCAGITVWVGWGTFWGATHSDPVPRVFFAAVFPLLLWLALASLGRAWLRPLAMLACGLCMWIHGVSALNCGAMFFSAFFFLRAPDTTLLKHALNLLFCLLAFLVPVCIFLWPSLAQTLHFSDADLHFFQQMQQLRWQEDFSHFWARLLEAFSPPKPLFFLSLLGLAGWFAVFRAREQRFRPLLQMVPAFLPGLAAVALLAWIEPLLAPDLGRLSMGHELVRGLRFLVPFAWLLIIAAVACYAGKWLWRLIFVVSFCALMLLNQDRQHLAVVSALEEICGLPLSEKAVHLIREAEQERALLGEILKIVPANEAVFCPRDQMPLRYGARRSVAHAFKDGSSFFYDKNLDGLRTWFAIEQALQEEPGGLEKAWKISGATWLLVPRRDLERLPPALRNSAPAMETPGWLLFHG